MLDQLDDAAGPRGQSSLQGSHPATTTPVGEPEWPRDAESDSWDDSEEEILGEDSDDEAFRAMLESFMKGENPSWSPAREEPTICYCAPPWQEETVYWDEEITDASPGVEEPKTDAPDDDVTRRVVPQSPEPSMPTLEDVEMMLK